MTAEVVKLVFDAGRIVAGADTTDVSNGLWSLEALRDIAERLIPLGCPEARTKVLAERDAPEKTIMTAWEELDDGRSEESESPA